jgi:hypothetical protein
VNANLFFSPTWGEKEVSSRSEEEKSKPSVIKKLLDIFLID